MSAAQDARAWPFEEARKLVKRFEKAPPEKGYVLFETGYGPSGLPHIGTFGEVARTSMVRRAFAEMSDLPTKLIAFSDDMDGLRKVPDNIPNQEMVAEHLGKPLTAVPDPFGEWESFGRHNNERLKRFLDSFGFTYDFVSATERYTGGAFDAALMRLLERYDAVTKVILPTLGDERRATYSPFLPVCPRTGQVLQAKVLDKDPAAGTILYEDPETGEAIETPVTGGRCKLQWKCDWAMRWYALGVDYEMAGKDLIDSVTLSSKIVKILGAPAPEGFNYELFLDEDGQKISKSKGNGLTIEEWLTYAPPESLALYMFQQPKRAKRLYFDVIPKATDDWLNFLDAYAREEDAKKRLDSPAWHVHAGEPPAPLKLDGAPIGFGMLLNLASACNAEDKDVLWGFISRYAADATPESQPVLDKLAGYAVRYFHDFVKPTKRFRAPDKRERDALKQLADRLRGDLKDAPAEDIQQAVYDIGKAAEFDPLRAWFQTLYETLLGQSQGPRFGSFAALYGAEATAALIDKALSDASATE